VKDEMQRQARACSISFKDDAMRTRREGADESFTKVWIDETWIGMDKVSKVLYVQ